SADHVRAAASLGQLDFGENKVQEGLDKIARTGDLPLRWHLIGHLQSNKAKQAVAFGSIQSVASEPLLQKIDRAAGATGRTVDVLVQVDLAHESTKFGVDPADLRPVLDTAAACSSVRLKG